MSTPQIARLLPSQRVKLAQLYRELAAVYRSGLGWPCQEAAAKIADMMAETFEKGRDEPIADPTPRSK